MTRREAEAIKAYITPGEYSKRDGFKLIFGKFKKKEVCINHKTITVYYVPAHRLTEGAGRRLKKELVRNGVQQLAFSGNVDVNFVNYFNEEFSVLICNRIILHFLDRMIVKAVGSLGIKKGKLSLGLVINPEDIGILDRLASMHGRLKCIYVYTDMTENVERTCDGFYADTGVSVVIRREIKEDQADVLIFKDGEERIFPRDVRLVIDVSGGKNSFSAKTITGVKLRIPQELKKLGIEDILAEKLMDEEYPISGFFYG